MRRISLVALALMLAGSAVASAQMQDPIVVSARQFAQQGNHDTAIQMLRGALASRPNDLALKGALADVLDMKLAALNRQLSELRQEISLLRGTASVAGARVITPSGSGCSPIETSPVRIGGAIRQPAKTRDVVAVYPPVAQSARVQGIVIVEATIGCDGSVTDAKVLRGQPLLNEAALEAVRQWRYTPTLLNGVPVPVIMTVTVTFRVD
jgi:TonB family protein